MKNYVNNQLGEAIDYDAAVMLMDEEICEKVNNEIAQCSYQQFYEAYCKEHKAKYNEDFAPDVGLAW